MWLDRKETTIFFVKRLGRLFNIATIDCLFRVQIRGEVPKENDLCGVIERLADVNSGNGTQGGTGNDTASVSRRRRKRATDTVPVPRDVLREVLELDDMKALILAVSGGDSMDRR